MSASLVGSEMCIRDSHPRGQLPIVWPRLRRATGHSPAHESIVVLLRNRPVSYTHLTLPTICSV
eukprot:15028267-Alexandrium_andersonii.AAC.1